MAGTLSLDVVVVASPTQVSSRLGDDAVILELEKGAYFGLEAVGSRIWELLAQPRMVSEIRDTIVGEFDVESDRCAADLLALLTQMADKGLIQVGSAPAP